MSACDPSRKRSGHRSSRDNVVIFCGGPRSIPSFATMQRKTAIIPMPRLPTGISVRSMLLPYIARPLLSFTQNIR